VGITNPAAIPDHDPLFSAPNLIVETHGGAPSAPAGGSTTDQKVWLVTRENMRRYANGEKMLSLVDTARGY
jgi:phosphoglycerate dehydrogenase-like enzyme